MIFFDDPSGLARASTDMLRRVGVTHEWWSVDELQRRYPHLDTGSWYPPTPIADPAFAATPAARLGGALFTPEAGYVSDPQLAAQNLADAAVRAGASLRVRTEVVGIDQADGRVRGVRLHDGTMLEADVVVNAAGPHSATINRMAGVARRHDRVDTPAAPAGHPRAAARRRGRPMRDRHPATADLDGGIYFRPDHQALLVGGVEAECDPLVWLDDPDDVDLDLDAVEWETQSLRARLGASPRSASRTNVEGVVGVYDVSDDWMPILDRSSLDGWFMAIGTSGNQFKNGPIIGHCMAELIDAVGSGLDHDREPLVVRTPYRGLDIDLGTFSRRRVGERRTTDRAACSAERRSTDQRSAGAFAHPALERGELGPLRPRRR